MAQPSVGDSCLSVCSRVSGLQSGYTAAQLFTPSRMAAFIRNALGGGGWGTVLPGCFQCGAKHRFEGGGRGWGVGGSVRREASLPSALADS